MKVQIIKISVLAVILLVISWFSVVFSIILLLLIIDFAYGYFGRVKRNKIPKLITNLKITDKINRVVPFVAIKIMGNKAITWMGKIYTKDLSRFTEKNKVHEQEHLKQTYECGWFAFYFLYLIEWIYRLVVDTKEAYKQNCFEFYCYDSEVIDTENLSYYDWFKKFLS